ncbi:hypothetical protein niasHS_014711 [Heterodera schachtii]|uniref:Glycosyl hydrolase family 13 catalytic domain-containing protein n=1 Tax=Heterodera schachtii TaxID=97005 RepID=A0ABD2IFE3_HETSC
MAATDGMVEDGKVGNDLESAKFTKDKEVVDIVQPTAKLIGLTKEQLEQYRNDPFWKAIRYSLFVAFWLIWLAMFVGAVLIVVLSPKCQQVNWTEKMVAYKIFTLAYKDSESKNGFGDFEVIEKKLDQMKGIGVNAIWPTPVLKYYKNALGPDAIEKLEVSDQLGGAEGFKKLIKRAHDNQIKVIVDLPLTVNAKGNWANKTSDTKNGIALIDLDNAANREGLKEAAVRFLDFGVDGLAITDYGLFANSVHLGSLVDLIRTIPKAEKIPIYARGSLKGPTEFYEISSLVGDVPSDGVNGLKKMLEGSIKNIEENGGNKSRIWQLGSMDPSGQRLDQLLGKESKSNEQKQRISSLFTSVHLFMPKPVVVLYGEELGLLSGKPTANKLANRIVYPWSNETFGNQSQGFFVFPQRTKNGDFESQKNDKHSPLALFKEIAKLREHSNFFSGVLSHSSSSDGLNFYKIKRSQGGFFVLVVNWGDKQKALDNKTLPDELKQTKLGAAKVIVSTDAVGKDGNVNFEMGETPIEMKPYGAMLMDMA